MAAVKILAADPVSLAGANLLPKGKFTVVSRPGISNENILREFRDFDVLLIRSTRKIDASFLRSSNLRIIATFTKGTDHIDTEAASLLGVKVMNAEEGNHISAAEHTVAMILSIYKNITAAEGRVRSGNFGDVDFRRNEVYGKNIGVIGFGKVGSYVGMLAHAFGMRVIANDTDAKVRSRHKDFEFRSLRYLLNHSDIVTVHIPLEKKNRGFMGAKQFSMMRKDAVFINTSRGAVTDEGALLEALDKRNIRFAGLDVFENEPNINPAFSQLKNVLMTNHIAGKTEESKDRISRIMFGKILKELVITE
ncbi:MAG: hypothetical protein K1X85_05080 [Ignavibacteria bacterium]|nr:hypothetical protein [Ignavibacteria bacterium]